MWIWLVAAIVTEVTGTLFLRSSEGFTRPLPVLLVLASYSFAFFALSRALVLGMQLGTAYAVWAGAGVALVALVGAAFLGERLTWVQVLGLALVVAGVASLELGGRHEG